MKQKFTPELVAPCGMNCSICSGYLAYSRRIPRKRGKISHCSGCRARNKKCAWLKGSCALLENGEVMFCSECVGFPCERLQHLDRRYRERYHMSMIENLNTIGREGIEVFLKKEQDRWHCAKCGGTICVHNGKCYDCEPPESWKG